MDKIIKSKKIINFLNNKKIAKTDRNSKGNKIDLLK